MLDGFRGDSLQLVILEGIVLLTHDPLSQGHQHLQRVHLVRVQHLLRGVQYVGESDQKHFCKIRKFLYLGSGFKYQYSAYKKPTNDWQK